MNLDELNKVAQAMVAPGRGILAADESSGTIKKRFDVIGVESTEDSRRDYREMLFRSAEGMKHISGVILYDETIWQKAKDGTPLVELIKKAGAIPGIKVDEGTKPLPFCPNELITIGLDKLADRLPKYYEQGARFAKWRAVIDIGKGIPTTNCIKANAHALARYAALCQEAQIVPIVEPEVLMDGDHDIDRCFTVTERVLHAVFNELFDARVQLEGIVLKPNMVISGKKCAKRAVGRGSRRENRNRAQAVRAGGCARDRFPFRRTERRRGDRPSRRHEQDRQPALEADVLVRPCASACAADDLERQNRKRRRRPARLFSSCKNERARRAGSVESRHGEKGSVNEICERPCRDTAFRAYPVACGISRNRYCKCLSTRLGVLL